MSNSSSTKRTADDAALVETQPAKLPKGMCLLAVANGSLRLTEKHYRAGFSDCCWAFQEGSNDGKTDETAVAAVHQKAYPDHSVGLILIV
jgi:hypothetical protein